MPRVAIGDVIDFLNFSEIHEQPQELRVGSSVVNILNSRTFFMKKLNPSARRGSIEHSKVFHRLYIISDNFILTCLCFVDTIIKSSESHDSLLMT